VDDIGGRRLAGPGWYEVGRGESRGSSRSRSGQGSYEQDL
jgi:hypothetical protein